MTSFWLSASNINRCIDDFTLCSEVWTGKTNVYGVGFLSRLPCGRHPRREIEEGKREKSTLVAKWNGLIGGGTFTFAFSLLMQSTSFTWSVFHLLDKAVAEEQQREGVDRKGTFILVEPLHWWYVSAASNTGCLQNTQCIMYFCQEFLKPHILTLLGE